ncbi:Cu,Zn superoxide dismutase-like protein [Annulohypoxylon truncatum]|uniref:Cu,Zn superoxide dismutase-like protein n=1 Tax=Annulohypoxylon truncatum TaxID=327061 RepID=UPI002007977B|nr:Cu,Zn superoxide dismutase-like protein [Annulohypoxylon truncatum]KAI1213454.1 Cu,Zn superoxide dismutase-like protein [Annulohypoxylon truncatum]
MMLRYLHGISFRSFATSTGFFCLGFATESYFHRNRRETSSYTKKNPVATQDKMAIQNQVKTPFQTLFAVSMTCDGCVKSISDALYNLDGITKVEANLKDQLVTVEGTAAPSAIVSAIESTGRDAILRGSGASNAVCILETYHRNEKGGEELVPASAPEASTEGSGASDREVRGLARMVQVSPTTTLIDLTVRGVTPGTYAASIREYGDLKFGATSTGPVWAGGSGTTQPRGILGTVQVGSDGRGATFLDHPFQVWEVIGHAMVVSRQHEGVAEAELKNDENTVVGVIARSAGMWDNDKTVCSCTGKTLWEERKDEVKKGMI